jgi:hypothetical protein
MSEVGGPKKWGILAWQVIDQRDNSVFPIAWSNIALCLIQNARGSDVWIIDLEKIKCEPSIYGKKNQY